MKNKKSFLLLIIVMAMTFVFANAITVEAASNKTTKKWATAYMKVVKKMNKASKNEKTSTYYDGTYKYDLIYFNNDKIPELVVGVDGYWVSMYTYDKKTNKVYTLMDQWSYGVGGNTGYSYIPKKNYLENWNSDYAGALRYVYTAKMQNNKLVDRNKKSLSISYFNDKNGNGYPDSEEYTNKPQYYYGKKKVSAKKFNSYLKSGQKKMIQGTMSFSAMKKTLKSKGAK